MKTSSIIISIIVIILIAVGIYYIAVSRQTPTPQSPNYSESSMKNESTTTSTSTATTSKTQTIPAIKNIAIQNFAFSPATLTIPVNTQVTWKNLDSANHQIKSDTFNSQLLSNGQTYSFKFTSKGTYDYTCAIHPSMKGKIIVQ